MNLSDLQTLYDFHDWARRRLMDSVAKLTPEQFTQDLRSSHQSLQGTLVHMMSAEWVWLSRWQEKSPQGRLRLEDFPTVAALGQRWDEIERQMRQFISGLKESDLARPMTYINFQGKSFTFPLWHMAQHVVNHSSYHRGQVVTMLRQLGIAPQATDLLIYYSQKSGQE